MVFGKGARSVKEAKVPGDGALYLSQQILDAPGSGISPRS